MRQANGSDAEQHEAGRSVIMNGAGSPVTGIFAIRSPGRRRLATSLVIVVIALVVDGRLAALNADVATATPSGMHRIGQLSIARPTLPLAFEPNAGQAPDDAAFVARG